MTSPLLDSKQLQRLVDNWLMDCGRRVRLRREALGITRSQLAAATGITPESVSRLERGMQAPRDNVRVAIAHVLGVEAEEIWRPIPRYQVDLVARKAA
jgi:transcriptional regulator with XRE-family HTH domain